MAKLTPFQKLKRAVSRLSVTSGSKFIQPDFEDSDIEFNANTYRPDFVSESRPDFASGSSKNYKNISQTSPPLFYSNDDLNFNYPSVVLNPHEASSSQAASFGGTTFPPFDRHEISRVPDLSDAHNAQNLPSAHNVKDGFNAPDPSNAHNAPNASQASKTSNPPQNLPRTSQEFVIPENTAANSQTAGAIFFLNIPTEPLNVNKMCSSTFYQLYQRNVISKEELRNTFVPIYNARTESEVKTEFVEFGKDNGVELLHFSQRIISMYENKDPVRSLKSWILPSLMTGLCQTRSNDEAADVCELFFHDLRSRFSDMKWANCKFYEVIFQKL